MKKINFKFIGILLLVILALGSCKKWIDPNVNTYKDSPPDVDMSVLLAYAETNMAYNTIGGNDNARVVSIWMQYMNGMARQSAIHQNYLLNNSDVNNLWNSTYSTSMTDLVQIMNKADVKLALPAEASVGHVYKGIAEVLLANCLGVTTDLWGDIPYSESFLGFDNLQPKFDTQEQIYVTIQKLLDDAIVHLNATSSKASRDLIYNGSASKWLAAAWAFKARYALHLSKVPGNTAYADALRFIDSGAIASNTGDCDFIFPGYPYSNPFYNFEGERGDVQMHSTLIDTLNGRFDPRRAAYADPNGDGDFIGAPFGYQGSGAEISWPGMAVAYENSPVQFITNTEVLFIKAEALLKSGGAIADVKSTLVAAVTASMEKWGVFDATYIAAYDAAIQAIPDAATQILFTEIMRQKWIAMYHQIEAFNDWRRTNNVIGLTANPGAAKAEIPRRFPYSIDEQTYNTNTPVIPNAPYQIWERVWWDKP